MKKTVLVSGGAGFIGSHVTVELIEAGYDVVVADNFSNCDRTCFEGVKKITGREDLPLVVMDFCDKKAVKDLFTKYHIDAVIHFAAFKAVGESVDKPLMYYQNNLVSFMNVLETAQEIGGCNVLFSSSATVYGEPDAVPVTEDTPRKPAMSPYGNTKTMCEDYFGIQSRQTEARSRVSSCAISTPSAPIPAPSSASFPAEFPTTWFLSSPRPPLESVRS